MFGTFAEVLSEQCLSLLLQDVGLIGRNAVPKLGLPLVEIVYSRKVEVFSMPAEKSLP